jgi:hypothetical protein
MSDDQHITGVHLFGPDNVLAYGKKKGQRVIVFRQPAQLTRLMPSDQSYKSIRAWLIAYKTMKAASTQETCQALYDAMVLGRWSQVGDLESETIPGEFTAVVVGRVRSRALIYQTSAVATARTWMG